MYYEQERNNICVVFVGKYFFGIHERQITTNLLHINVFFFTFFLSILPLKWVL